jgi:protein-S-isoprenylcysteine O-methyltransferase Ste14
VIAFPAGMRAPGAPTRREGRFAWAGAALFAGSLAYFLFSYVVTFGEIAAGPLTAGALVTNTALFSVFGLHHSVFARERVRAWVARQFTPALERSVYVWTASLMLILVCALWRPVPGVAWDVGGAPRWLLHGAQLFGVWLTLRSAAVIDVWELAGVRQAGSTPNSQHPTPKSDAGNRPEDWELEVGSWEFRTEGPYGWVRHPIYLGWFLIVFPVPLMTMTRLLFAVVSSVYILIAIPFEERSLRRTSGGAYEPYRRKVRWKLIPRLY